MATTELSLRVITPDKIALEATVRSLQVPGTDGSIGILPRHAAMVAALDAGPMHWVDSAGKAGDMFVSGGFAEVRDGTVRVVTEAGELPEEIDEERAREAEARARERLHTTIRGEAGELDLMRAQHSLRRALSRLRVRSSR